MIAGQQTLGSSSGGALVTTSKMIPRPPTQT